MHCPAWPRKASGYMAVAFDEMNGPDGDLRPAYQELSRWLKETPPDALEYRRQEAELLFRRIGITFAVYGDAEAQERLIPFDVIPRIMSAKEWAILEKGLKQRVRALNMFLRDIYHGRDVLRANVIPDDLIFQNPVFRPEMNGQNVPHDVYVHIAGIDIVRVNPENFFVLEDNARTPSGVSYMLENREIMMRLFPDLFARHRVAPVERYPDELLSALRSVAPLSAAAEPTVALMTPGVYNSAYYEHSFLADKLGIELVEGRDLIVKNDEVFMRTTEGLKRVDVIYRRVDDDFLDPLTFRPDSALGGPGLMSAYAAGNITLANAVGTGIADDKAIYSYMPEVVKFYLGEEPILKNVPTWRCREPKDLAYVLDNLAELVVKEVHGSGGYGMLIGPAATKATREAFRDNLEPRPGGFIAPPALSASFYGIYDQADEHNGVEYLSFSPANPSSIRNCIENARLNSRSVRTALTSEMWDTINSAWIELQEVWGKGTKTREELNKFLRFVQEISLRFDGSAYRTMLRNDAYWFSRLGLHLERADNTARILDVKYHVLLPEEEHVGGPLDYYQWTSILRSVSALTAYHWVYRETLKPWLIADLLILNDSLPRSLASCYGNLVRNLHQIRAPYPRQGPSQRHARGVRNRLEHSHMDDIFQHGVHEFIQEFILDNSRLGEIITKQYLI